jgi:hypothetical protein
MRVLFKGIPRTAFAAVLFLGAFHAPASEGLQATAASSAAASRPENPQAADSAARFPGKLPAQEPWERWVNLPGTVLWFLPDLALRGAGRAIGLVDEHKIIPKAHRVLVSEDGPRAILPAYSVRTGAGVVFRKKDLINEGSRLSLFGAAGEDWRHGAAFAFRRIGLPGALETDLRLDYRFLTEEIYFGIGPRRRHADGADYSRMSLEGAWSLAAFRGSSFSLEATGSLGRDEIIAGRDDDFLPIGALYDEASAPGLDRRSTLAGGRLEMRFDSYDSPDPKRGGEIRIASGFHNDVGGEPFAFWKSSVRAERLVPIAHGRVIALRAAGERAWSPARREIPFHQLPGIGEDGTVRGYARGRYRDRDALWGSAEYRWPIWTPHFKRAVEFLLFADGGQVGRDLSRDFDWELVRYGFGGGLRYYGDEGLIARFEVGAGREQLRFYFSLN